MQICTQILVKVETIVMQLIAIIEEVVKTVCGWVTSTIRTVKEVTKKVCKWLPWPVNKLCNWVTRLIEVFETVTKWVCEEILVRIIRYVRVAVLYILYVLRWVCWIVDWLPRFVFELLPCLLGVNLKKRIPLCVKILVDRNGVPVIPINRVHEFIGGARDRFEQCNIDLCVASIELVTAPDDIDEFTCGADGFFSKHHLWFEENKCGSGEITASIMTVFMVPKFDGAKGCAISRTDYIVAGADASLATIAHELGHHADLLHRDDPSNVMMDGTTEASIEFTRWQCCMIRSARFATEFNLKACRFESVDVRISVR